MIIAVTYQDGQVFQHFGHSEAFKLYQVEAADDAALALVKGNLQYDPDTSCTHHQHGEGHSCGGHSS